MQPRHRRLHCARRTTAIVLAGLVGASLLAIVPAAVGDEPLRVLDGQVADWPGTSTMLGGTTQYSGGELIYQDHLFDDLGADTGARSKQHGTVAAPKGDFRYPTDTDRYADNAADLLDLRLTADTSDLWVLARLNTLRVADTTVVAVALDTDNDPATGGGAWPFDAGLSVPGADVVITLWGAGGSLTDLPDGTTVALDGAVAASTDNADNAIEARIPLAALGDPSTMRVWAATGLWDAAAGSWMAVPPPPPTNGAPGGGGLDVASRAFNVAFRSNESGSFMEEQQAAALNTGDISAFSATVDLALLQAGATVPYEIEPGRLHVAIVDQGFSIPPYDEGLAYGGIPGRFEGAGGAALQQTFSFWGRYQPYAIYLPSTYDGSTALPAALVLHGLGGSHITYNAQPGFLADMGEGNGSSEQPPLMLVTPLGRGSSFYADWGEADTLAVLDDVIERFPVDESRLYLTGYSMGGYGVFRLASLYPDRFAAAASWAGYTGEFLGTYTTDPKAWLTDPTGIYDIGAAIVQPLIAETGLGGGRQGKASIGNPVDTMENLRHLPLVQLTGTNDEIVPTPGQYAAPRRLAELGYRSRFDLYPGYEHFSFALVDDWTEVRSWLGDRRRTETPRQITYKFSDAWTAPGLAAALGLVHDGAWWLRGLTMRDTTDDGLTLASASATSWGVAQNDVRPIDVLEPSTAPTPHLRKTVWWQDGEPLPVLNRLELDLARVGTVDIEMADARVATCGLDLSLRTDGPTTIVLRGTVPANVVVTGATAVDSSADETAGRLTIITDGAVDGVLHLSCPTAPPGL